MKHPSVTLPALALGAAVAALGVVQACAAVTNPQTFGAGGAGPTGATGPTGAGGAHPATTSTGMATLGVGGAIVVDGGGTGGACGGCSTDFHSVIDCSGHVVEACTGTNGCDASKGTCANACDAAFANKQSVGCEYYATFMDQDNPSSCFAVFVANTWDAPAHLSVEYGGMTLPIGNFARIPQGFGPSLTYQPYNPGVGLTAGQVAILFLSGPQGVAGPGQAFCPVNSAIESGVMLNNNSGISYSFRIVSDVPVVAYETNPYGGGSAAVTGASLLLPTSVWDTNYVAVTVAPYDIANPSLNIVASQDLTHVKMVPTVPVAAAPGIPGGPANVPFDIILNKGQNAQISQMGDLTGSVLQADKPIGFMAGQNCMHWPMGIAYCDHGEQMVPPVKALGSEYVGVMYRPRVAAETQTTFHLIGTVNGTQLTWTPNVGGPTTLSAGQMADVVTGTPFVVKSQDAAHPFMLFTYMSGSTGIPGMDSMAGYGDPDFVLNVPPQQYMTDYVIFTDPTYPETNLVLVRSKTAGAFADVTLDCAGVLTGWQPVGDYEWTRADLSTGDFQAIGACSNGRHELKSAGRFGLWVWGWGTPLTQIFTQNVSYGYPGGMNVQPINKVVIPPIPK